MYGTHFIKMIILTQKPARWWKKMMVVTADICEAPTPRRHSTRQYIEQSFPQPREVSVNHPDFMEEGTEEIHTGGECRNSLRQAILVLTFMLCTTMSFLGVKKHPLQSLNTVFGAYNMKFIKTWSVHSCRNTFLGFYILCLLRTWQKCLLLLFVIERDSTNTYPCLSRFKIPKGRKDVELMKLAF